MMVCCEIILPAAVLRPVMVVSERASTLELTEA